MSLISWIVGIMSNVAFSILLMGIVIGFGAGKWRTGTSPTFAVASPPQVIQAPTPQALQPPPGAGCRTR